MTSPHLVGLTFHGAAGTVTPSASILRTGIGDEAIRILVDAGSDMDNEDKGLKGAVREKVDAILVTHPHTDHCGQLPEWHLESPGVPIYIPEGSKGVLGIMAREAYKRKGQQSENVQAWLNNVEELFGQLQRLETQFLHTRRRKKRRVPKRKKHRPFLHNHEWENSLVDDGEQHDIVLRQILHAIDEEDDGHLERWTVENIRKSIREKWQGKIDTLRKNGIITNVDVDRTVASTIELPLKAQHKVRIKMKELGIKMTNTGHLLSSPAAQILLQVPGPEGSRINVLYSGDRGRGDLPAPYPKPDDEGLHGKANVLIMESTYGGRKHADREIELSRFDAILLEAIKKGEDVIIPTISLDRPEVVIYEIIVRLIDTNTIRPDQLDFSFLGRMIGDLKLYFQKNNPVMWRKIRNYFKPLKQKPGYFAKNIGKTRICFAGGGFLPPKEGVPVCSILHEALQQESLTIVFPNYCGKTGSNGKNLVDGKKFYLGRNADDGYTLTPGQKVYQIGAFSGHADGVELVQYAATVCDTNAVIYLNHGDERARESLKEILEADPRIIAKNIKVVLPKLGQEYAIKKRHNKTT